MGPSQEVLHYTIFVALACLCHSIMVGMVVTLSPGNPPVAIEGFPAWQGWYLPDLLGYGNYLCFFFSVNTHFPELGNSTALSREDWVCRLGQLLTSLTPALCPTAARCVLSPASEGYPAWSVNIWLVGKVGILVDVSKQAGFFLVGEVQRNTFISAF